MIKKQLIVLSLSLFVGLATFAQKSELKAADKALKKKDYASALSAITQAESLIANADAKSKAKFYFIKGMALYGNGSDLKIDAIADALNKVMEIEKGNATSYSSQASETLKNIAVKLNEKANKNYQLAKANKNADDFIKSADGFFSIYKLLPDNKAFLYSSAISNYEGENYQKSLDQFQQLLDMNFDGVRTIYKAKSIVNGKDESFGSKAERDKKIAQKLFTDASEEKTPSLVNEIVKFMALNHVGLGQDEKALSLITTARDAAPNDYNLLIEEAKIYYAMDNMTKYAEIIEEALILEPNDPQLHNIIGALAIDTGDLVKAEKHLKKALELDSKRGDAYKNMGNLILRKSDVVLKEMNDYLSKGKWDKSDQIKAEKWLPLQKESLQYLEKAYELSPSEFSKNQLNSIYENLEMDKKIE